MHRRQAWGIQNESCFWPLAGKAFLRCDEVVVGPRRGVIIITRLELEEAPLKIVNMIVSRQIPPSSRSGVVHIRQGFLAEFFRAPHCAPWCLFLCAHNSKSQLDRLPIGAKVILAPFNHVVMAKRDAPPAGGQGMSYK
jgi:hypothetical protein